MTDERTENGSAAAVKREERKSDEAEYTKSTAQLDMEQRMEPDYVSPLALNQAGKDAFENDEVVNPLVTYAPYATGETDTSEYRGTDEIYMNYADDRSRPFKGEGGAEAAMQDQLEQGFAVAKPADPPESKRTLGGGSTVETVHTRYAGEGLVPEIVDREKVYEDETKRQAEVRQGELDGSAVAPATSPDTGSSTPTKSTPAPAAKAGSKTTPASK